LQLYFIVTGSSVTQRNCPLGAAFGMVEDRSCGQLLFHSSHPSDDSCSLLKGDIRHLAPESSLQLSD